MQKLCVACKRRRRPSAYTLSPTFGRRVHNRCDDCQREFMKNHNLQMRYGINLAQYEELCEAQQGRCLVCKDEAERLVVDHCHTSGKIRGLVCSPCNLALGHSKDDPARLIALAKYLWRRGY